MRALRSLLSVPAVAILIAACSSSSTPARSGGDGGCISPAVGQSCAASDMACQPHDPCCTGYEWMCQSGTWQQAQLGCACQVGVDASGDAPATDAPAGDGGCITPVVGQACTASQAACQPADPCCAGYEWTCDGTLHTWQKAGLGCACQVDAGARD